MNPTLALFTTTAIVAASAAAAQDGITFTSWGGTYQEAQRAAYLDPIEDELGITIREETLGGVTEVRAQVLSGAVTWDLIVLGASECAQGQIEGLFEPIDYDVVSTEGFAPGTYDDTWASIDYYATVIAYDTDIMEGKEPKSWADFWDVENFPGSRALRNHPTAMLEAALMADGVAKDELYPLDIDRAFAKMEEIKPHIDVWWTSGAQSVQLLADGEVDMLPMWNGRIDALLAEDMPVAANWNQGMLTTDCLAIPKGAPNKDLAMKVMARMLSPELQANLPGEINYGPTTSLAFEQGKITDEQVAMSPSSPEKIAQQAVLNVQYWAENMPAIRERWDAFLVD